ncbi:MAG: MFS transporter [Polyangiaceae bacterium]
MQAAEGAAPGERTMISRRTTIVLAIACGVTVANLYYAQPIVQMICTSLGIGADASGLVVTVFQLGYVGGLFLLAPLGDLVDNKKLVVRTLAATVLGLAVVAASASPLVFFVGAFATGVCSAATQMILPIVGHFTRERERGRVVGTVTGGLLFGILLARPLSTLVAGAFGWRAVFGGSAALMAFVTAVVAHELPDRKPVATHSYFALLRSLGRLLVENPVLQRRAAYQALAFCAFILFWTTVPMLLVAPPISLSSVALSLFLLSGAAGALAAPVAGWMADRGWTRPATVASLALIVVAFVFARAGTTSVALLVVAGVLLDAGTQTNLVLGQRVIYVLAPGSRSRLNSLYIGLFFFGGALGSSVAGSTYARAGWGGVTAVGIGIASLALVFVLLEIVLVRERG